MARATFDGLPRESVEVRVYNLAGERLMTVSNLSALPFQGRGYQYEATLDVGGLPPGTYAAAIKTSATTALTKFIVLK